MRRVLLITFLAAVTPWVSAQRIGPNSPHFGPGFNRSGHQHAFFSPLVFSDPFYSDYLSSTGYPSASQPPVIILQSPPAAAPVPERSPTPAQPLMIELRGDRYVRISGEESSESQMIDPTSESSTQSGMHPHPATRTVATPAAPAVLIFRDGHREEVSSYTIADGALYTVGAPYTGGGWNKRIELSSLNLPETVNSNQSRGVRFQLPSAPNEVFIGP